MDDAKFDRLARAFAETVSRRQMVALISAVTGVLGQQAARGSQLEPATCGEQGAVCTLVSGCCDGLTCVTSAINASYGICVPGDGGMVSTGTTLISPFRETAVDEVSALLESASIPPASDPQAEQLARIAEIRARRESRRTERKTRLDTKRATVQARKDEQGNRQREARDAKEGSLGPKLQLKLLFSEDEADSGLDANELVPIEELRVTNRDDVNVLLTHIETIMGDTNSVDLTAFQFTLRPGESYLFVSGLPTEDAPDAAKHRFLWMDKVACDGEFQRQGYRVKAAFSRNAKNHEFVVRCDRPHTVGVVEPPAAAPPRKRNSQHQKGKKR